MIVVVSFLFSYQICCYSNPRIYIYVELSLFKYVNVFVKPFAIFVCKIVITYIIYFDCIYYMILREYGVEVLFLWPRAIFPFFDMNIDHCFYCYFNSRRSFLFIFDRFIMISDDWDELLGYSTMYTVVLADCILIICS